MVRFTHGMERRQSNAEFIVDMFINYQSIVLNRYKMLASYSAVFAQERGNTSKHKMSSEREVDVNCQVAQNDRYHIVLCFYVTAVAVPILVPVLVNILRHNAVCREFLHKKYVM